MHSLFFAFWKEPNFRIAVLAVAVALTDSAYGQSEINPSEANPNNPAASTPAAPGSAGSTPSNSAPAPNPTPGDIIKSLVVIQGDASAGTGFITKLQDQFVILTNQHVLSGNKKFAITGMDGTKYPTNGDLFGSVNYDVAALKIPANLVKNYLELQDDTQSTTQVNDNVVVPGNSLGARVPLQITGKLLGIGPELVEVDAKFVAGNSGSPIIDKESGKVIGIATMTITHRSDGSQKDSVVSSTRWFGYRLDNIDPKTGWQKLDWLRFSNEGIKLAEIENLSDIMIAILKNDKMPLVSNTDIKTAMAAFEKNISLAEQQKSKKAFADAFRSFTNRLHNIASTDFTNLSGQHLYPYHAGRLKELLELQKELDSIYSDITAEVSTMMDRMH